MYDCTVQHPPLTSKFTGKERDSESNLDNFGARYDSSSLGRFMSPDPSSIKLSPQPNPQALNLYSYVENNPLRSVDPIGKETEVITLGASAGNRSSGFSGGSNPFGHTAIRIKNSKGDFVYSLGPRKGDNAAFLSKTPTAQYLQDHFKNEPNRSINGQVLNIESDGKTEKAVQGWLEAYLKQQSAADKNGNLPQYSPVTHNCSETVCAALRAGGLNIIGGFVTPGGVEANLTDDDVAWTENADQFRQENIQMNSQQTQQGSQEVQNEAARECALGNPAACD